MAVSIKYYKTDTTYLMTHSVTQMYLGLSEIWLGEFYPDIIIWQAAGCQFIRALVISYQLSNKIYSTSPGQSSFFVSIIKTWVPEFYFSSKWPLQSCWKSPCRMSKKRKLKIGLLTLPWWLILNLTETHRIQFLVKVSNKNHDMILAEYTEYWFSSNTFYKYGQVPT